MNSSRSSPGGDLVDVRALVREVAAGRVDHLDVGGVAAGPPAREHVGQERRGDARVGGVRRGAQPLDAVAARAAAAPGVAARDADVARDGAERVGRAVELLAVARAPGRVAAVERGGLERGEFARQPPDGRRRNAREGLGPLRCFRDAVREPEEVRAVRRARRRAFGQVGLVEARARAGRGRPGRGDPR